MPKKEYDSFVTALINLKGMISNLKMLSHVIAFDAHSPLVYMTSATDMHDCFTIMNDRSIIEAADKFQYHIINTVDVVAFNKALKKSKTVSEIKDDKTIFFSTEGYEETLSIYPLPDYANLTKTYQKLFRDSALTKGCLNAVYDESTEWIALTEFDIDGMRNNELVISITSTDDTVYISKSLFGNIKKTLSISHTVIQKNESDIVVLFRQCEDGYTIYHVLRFLTDI